MYHPRRLYGSDAVTRKYTVSYWRIKRRDDKFVAEALVDSSCRDVWPKPFYFHAEISPRHAVDNRRLIVFHETELENVRFIGKRRRRFV